MSRLSGRSFVVVVAGNIPPDHAPDTPGEWQITEGAPGDRRIAFGCPLKPGSSCGVNLKPHSSDAHGVPSWLWNGSQERPSLTPSINCIKDEPRSYGCGWHGFLTDGVFRP